MIADRRTWVATRYPLNVSYSGATESYGRLLE
jgi:hypothetical protein